MSLRLIERKRVWSNDGTAAITGLASAAARWLVPNGTSVTASPDATTWIKVDVGDADALAVQYTGKIINLGGMTAAASSAWSIPATGLLFDPQDSDLIPGFVNASPALYVPAANTATAGHELWWAADRWSAPYALSGATTAVAVAGPFGYDDTSPSANDQVGITMRLCRKPFLAHGGAATFNATAADVLGWKDAMSEYQTVWLAITFTQTFTGATVANMRLKASMDILLYKDIQYTMSVPKNFGFRKDMRMSPGPPAAP